MRGSTSGSTDEPQRLNVQRLLNPSVNPLTGAVTPGVVRVTRQGSSGPKTPGRGQRQGHSTGGVKGSCISG